MTAIQKMVEWLYNLRGFATDPNAVKGIEIALTEARRLAAEEAKEKPSAPACGACIPLKKECENCERMRPSAPASLVEELTNWCHKILDGDQEIYGQSRLAARWITEEILPRYRPSKTEDIVKTAFEEVSKLHVYKMDTAFRHGVTAMHDEIIRKLEAK